MWTSAVINSQVRPSFSLLAHLYLYHPKKELTSSSSEGAVPHALATHPTLLKLHVSDNNLTELPVEWVQMVYTESSGIAFPLEDVDVSENSIAVGHK